MNEHRATILNHANARGFTTVADSSQLTNLCISWTWRLMHKMVIEGQLVRDGNIPKTKITCYKINPDALFVSRTEESRLPNLAEMTY